MQCTVCRVRVMLDADINVSQRDPRFVFRLHICDRTSEDRMYDYEVLVIYLIFL